MKYKVQNRNEQIQIVHDYCSSLEDGIKRTVCFFLADEKPRPLICRALNLRPKQLASIIDEIAGGLLNAGIRLREKEA